MSYFSFQHTTQHQAGIGALPVIFIIVALSVVGFFVYNGISTQEDISSMLPPEEPSTMTEDSSEDNGDGTVVEIGAEDEMLMAPEDDGTMSEDSGGDSVVEEDVVVKEFTITGKNYEFSQDTIRVTKGDRVRITFTSTNGFHDWVVDELSAATKQVTTGNSTSVEFVADKAGEFEYYCSVGNHRQLGMVGTLIVE